MDIIAYGLCHCGCGEKAPISSRTHRRYGWVKGEPKRFIFNHHKRVVGPQYTVKDCGYATSCWIWNGNLDNKGYGWYHRNPYKGWRAHRAYFTIENGCAPDQLHHLCEQKSCVRPTHLQAVTDVEHRKIHPRWGMDNPSSKFTLEEVQAIRRIYKAGGLSQQSIGHLYGVAQSTIGRIVRRRSYPGIS